MNALVNRTRSFIARHDLLPAGSRILLGLSGGIDSMTLADVLRQLAPEAGWDLHAAYVNHGWRAEAEREAVEIGRYCQAAGIGYRTRRVAPAPAGLSPEEAARHARYDALNALAAEIGADRLALAHHADDQLETLLFRWVQGSGAGGLTGMAALREQVSGPPVVRPFLEVSRAEIAAAHAARGLPAWEDPTNRDPALPRNLLRSQVVPPLKELNPRLLEALPLRLAVQAAEHAWLEGEAQRAEARARRHATEGLVAWEREGFQALPRVLRRRALHAAYAEVGGATRRLTARALEAVLDRWDAGAAGAIDLADGVRAVLQGGWVALDRDPAPVPPLSVASPPQGEGAAIAIEGQVLRMRLEPTAAGPSGADQVAFDAGTWPADAVLRRADPHRDRFVPWGHATAHGLNRFFTRSGVFEPLRRRQWVIATGSEVLWVLGMRRSALLPVPEGAEAVLALSWGREARFDIPPSGTYHEG